MGFADFFQAGLGALQAAFVLDGDLLFGGFSDRGQRIREVIKRRLAVDFLIYSRLTFHGNRKQQNGRQNKNQIWFHD